MRWIAKLPRQGLFDLGAEFYAWMTWQDTWRAHCRELANHFGACGQAPRVLDLGIGPGISAISILDVYPQAQVTGLDFSSQMIKTARRYIAKTPYHVELICADAANLPFEDDSFDVVTAHSFLYLVPPKKEVLEEARRVLKPGGRCVFLEPHYQARHRDWMGLDGNYKFKLSMFLWKVVSGSIGGFSESSLSSCMSQVFEDVHVERTLNGMALWAWADTPLHKDAPDECAKPAGVDE